MSDKKKQQQKKLPVIILGFLLGLCLVVGMSLRVVYAADTEDGKLKNGSFEEEQTWTGGYNTQDQEMIPDWHTTASDGKIELFRKNQNTYIPGVTLAPTAGNYAAELNANEESTLYQNVKTTPSSIYEWGLDHGARNGTDNMALVIGPKQAVDPSKPSKTGRDQLMQMVDWLIAQGKTSVKDSAGLGEHLVVYSKKFAANGTFQDDTGNNPFSLTPSTIYTEEWHVWIIADSRGTSGDNPWGKYGSNAEGSAGSTGIDTSKYYLYTVPSGQTETLFGFVSVGYKNSATSEDKAKTYGNFLDNINFHIFHPLSGSTTLHGSGVVGGSDGTTEGEEGSSTGYEVTVDNELITYAVDGEPLKVQAVVKKADGLEGCEFVGMYYTRQDAAGDLVTVFLQKAGHEIEDTGSLTDAEKIGKWIKSTNSTGDTIYTYYLDNITSATDLHFVFIKSPTVTYDPNGGKDYIVARTHNTEEAANVYSYKPVVQDGVYTFIAPYVSHAAEGQNDGWKFMGWLLTGDTVDSIPGDTQQINADELGRLLLPAVHTIACDYSGEQTKKEQYFKIWNKEISETLLTQDTNNITYTKWATSDTTAVISYANVHKGLTLVAQWRWRQAFLPQIKNGDEYIESTDGGTVKITSVTDTSDPNYNGSYNEAGGKAYYAETDEIVTAVATAKEGYEFEGWYDGAGNLLSTKATYSFTETKENVGTYYARFSGKVTQTYIRQVKNGEVWVNTEDDNIAILDRYSYSDTVGKYISSTATVKEGYEFVGWYDEAGNEVAEDKLSNDKKTLGYTTTGDAKYYARFQRSASGTMTQTFIRQLWNGNDWTELTDDNKATLNRYSHSGAVGETASSTATAKTGYKFEGWYDALGNKVDDSKLIDNGTTLRYTTVWDATYYARFSKIVTQTFVPQVKDGTEWKEITDNTIATLNYYEHIDGEGATASSTATAGTGYKFLGWYDTLGNKVEEETTLSYTTTGDATYYARFETVPPVATVTQTFTRQVKVGETWEDTTEDNIGTLDSYSHTDVVGETASSTATAGEGYQFVGWYDASGYPVAGDMLINGGVTLSYTTIGNATYYARFKIVESVETVTQTYIRQVKEGENWIDTTEDSIGILNPYTHSDVVGATASSTATSREGYEFVGWYDAYGNPVASEMLSNGGITLSYTTTGDAVYYARFERIPPVVTVTQTYIRQLKEGETWIETTDDTIATLDCYIHSDVVGATASSTATAREGYEFVGWYDAYGNPVAGEMLSNGGITLSYTTTGDAVYYACFERIPPVVTVTQTYIRQLKEGETWIETTDDAIATLDRYIHSDVLGATASSTATAKEGYEFVGWYDAYGNPVAGEMLSNGGITLSYTTTGDAVYYARFERIPPVITVTQTYIRQLKEGENWIEITDDAIATLDLYTHSDVLGATASSTAAAKEGYEFVGWYDAYGNPVAGEMLSNGGITLSYTTTGDATYYARFARIIVNETYANTFTKEGETLQLATIVTPEFVAGKSMIWSSSNPNVATVDANGNIIAVGNGTCTITVITEDGSYTATCIIKVEIPSPADNTNHDNTNHDNTNHDNTGQDNTNHDDASLDNANTDSQKTAEENTKTEEQVVKTGDDSNLTLWTTLLLFVSGVTVMVRRKKINSAEACSISGNTIEKNRDK